MGAIIWINYIHSFYNYRYFEFYYHLILIYFYYSNI
jgi:hypothetical protein